MPDIFSSARRKLDRGKYHIDDLKARVKAFEDLKPYERATERDAQKRRLIHKIKLAQPIPGFINEIVADAIANLRDALDHAGYAIAVATGKPNARETNFPFSGSSWQFKINGLSRCKDLPNDIQTLFASFHPYKGGDDLLWALARICVLNKHTALVNVGPAIVAAERVHAVTTGQWHIDNPWVWDGLKNEVMLGWSSIDSDFKCEFKITFDVTFGEVEIVEGQPAAGVLDALAGIVERILLATEAEARRLFPANFT